MSAGPGAPVRVAAIDVGTNTTRLLAVEAGADHGGEPRELDRRLLFTRLGEGVDATRMLNRAAIDRTVAAIAGYVEHCRYLGVGPIRVAGTSAVREAANREELQDAVRDATGLELEVIPGEAEAALSFAGATADLPGGRYLVCDIGGGSTELAEGTRPGTHIAGRISMPLGVVRLTERHLANDPPTPEELAALEAVVDLALVEAERALPDPAGAGFVGVAGTVTSLAAIRLGLDRYDPKAVHGSSLTFDEVRALYQRLAAMALPAREALPPLPPGRADVIVAGCAILTRVMARWRFPAVRVSEKDILDGLVSALLE